MSTEERLELLLRRETERYQPEERGFERITAKLGSRRRRRVAARSSLGVVAVGVIAALVVTLAGTGTGTGGERQNVAVGPASPQPAGPLSPVLVTVSRTAVQFLSPATGTVLRTVPLASRLTSVPIGQIAASPSGGEVYAAVYNSNLDTRCPRELVAINTATGARKVIATGVSAPAVNPAGTELAYLTGNGPLAGTGVSRVCLPTTVTVQDLRTGTRRSWRISPPAVRNQGTEILESLAWAPQGADLVIGSGAGPYSGIQILDTAKPASATNPATVGPWATPSGLPPGRYASPVEQRNGTIAALAPGCWGFMKCVAPVSVKSVDPATGAGHTLATFTNREPTGLVADPTGRRLIAEIPTGTNMQLVSVADHKTVGLTTVPGPVAWAALATAEPAKTTPTGKVTVTLRLPSHVMASGATMHAQIIVDNRTGHPIHTTGCGGIFAVVLTNRTISGSPAWPLCLQQITFPAGRSTTKLTIEASYQGCGFPGVPRCTTHPRGPPPLPPGRYQATTFESNHALPIPRPQPVLVTPDHSR